MKKLNQIILECYAEDEKIDNMCVDEFIKYIQTKDSTHSQISIDGFASIKLELNIDNKVDYEQLSQQMKNKLQKSREKGRYGWWNDKACPISYLHELYKEHLQKCNENNNIDIIIFAMFIYFKQFKEVKI